MMQHSTSPADALTPTLSRDNGRWRALRYFLRHNPLAMTGIILFGAIVLACLLAPLLASMSPTEIDIRAKLSPPSATHWLGTDLFGRDVWSRILYGGRSTVTIGVVVIAIAFVLGVPLGITSGVIGGRADAVLMRLVDALLSFPALVLAIALAAALGPSLENAMLAVAITFIPQFARVARGQALDVRSRAFVEGGEAIGVGRAGIMWRYVLPNAIGPLLVQASLGVGSAILQTASLGFLGLGAQPPAPEWGADVAANTQFLRESPWVAIAPGAAILLTVVAVNLLGDALVDWSNPRTRQGN